MTFSHFCTSSNPKYQTSQIREPNRTIAKLANAQAYCRVVKKIVNLFRGAIHGGAQINLPFKLLQTLRMEPEDVTRIDGSSGNCLLSLNVFLAARFSSFVPLKVLSITFSFNLDLLRCNNNQYSSH